MNTFENYLIIGNGLEEQGKYLLAYTMYLEALRYADSVSSETIEKYLQSYYQKITFNFSELNDEIKGQFITWIKQDYTEYCFICLTHLFESLDFAKWIDNDNCIIYHWLAIWFFDGEKKGKPYSSQNITFDSIKSEYYMLKFLIRRSEMNVSDGTDLSDFITTHNIPLDGINYMIQKTCFSPSFVYTKLINFYKNQDRFSDYQYFKNMSDNAKDEFYTIPSANIKNGIHSDGDFAIITAVSDENMYAECLYYINHLNLPKNCNLTIHPIRNATSMTEAYNIGCSKTNAKYKIYIHQDTMLINQNLLYELLSIFETPAIGMVGVAGVRTMPKSCIWWEGDGADDYRNIYQDTVITKEHTLMNPFSEPYKNVCVLDGVFLATQYDIPWREDLFDGWHYYDMSQSMEFQKKGYSVVVANQSFPWCLHEQKCNKTLGSDFTKYQSVFQKEYGSLI